jgi:hypothetical protein
MTQHDALVPAEPQPGDRLTSTIRTVVPTLWAAVIVWAAARGIPRPVLDLVDGLVEPLLVPLVLGAVHAAARWLETQRWAPRFVVRVLLGSLRQPTYTPPVVDGQVLHVRDHRRP